jgi:putative DNA methylase
LKAPLSRERRRPAGSCNFSKSASPAEHISTKFLLLNITISRMMADTMTLDDPSAWRSRGYLPHWEAGETAQMIGFRLADSLPAVVLQRWQEELNQLPEDEASVKRRQRIEVALDTGHGEAWLRDAGIADTVERALLYFDGTRYRLHSWVVMPNHVHVIATPLEHWSLADIVHSWKSFTAKKANAILKRSGSFWAREYYDRVIRDEGHHADAIAYVARNPVKAGLCRRPEDWRYSSAWKGRSLLPSASSLAPGPIDRGLNGC